MVRGTFSPARAWRPAVVARLARTLGITRTEMQTQFVPVSRTARLPRTARRGRSAPSSRQAPARLQELPCASPRGEFGARSDPVLRMHRRASNPGIKVPTISRKSVARVRAARATVPSIRLRSAARRAAVGSAMPNTSLKLSANGVAHWPSGAGPAAHFAPAVQCTTPLSPA